MTLTDLTRLSLSTWAPTHFGSERGPVPDVRERCRPVVFGDTTTAVVSSESGRGIVIPRESDYARCVQLH